MKNGIVDSYWTDHVSLLKTSLEKLSLDRVLKTGTIDPEALSYLIDFAALSENTRRGVLATLKSGCV